MSQTAADSKPYQAASTGRVGRARQWLRRAAGSGGHERHTLALIGKSTVAALAAWMVAHDVMAAQSPAFAPFSAVLIMQVTVYQSLLQALRYVAAVSVGVALQGVLGFLAGPHLLTFGLVTLAALTIGRWRSLGSQGSQVATAAFFAYSTYVAATSSDRWSQLAQIIVLVLIGCGIGVLINVLVLPPMRYRSAEYGLRTLAHSLCDLIGDVRRALREGKLEEDRTRHWRQRSSHLPSIVRQAQASVHTAWESTYYNPRRLLRRHRYRASFSGYQAVIDALERVAYQAGSLTRSLDQWQQFPGPGTHDEGFLRAYGDFLAAIGHITELLSRVEEEQLTHQSADLCTAAEEAQRCRDNLEDTARNSSLPLTDPAQPYGILLGEATRLMDDVQNTCDVLKHGVDTTQRPAAAS